MDKYYWLERYSWCCKDPKQSVEELPKFKIISNHCNGNFSRENILSYFLGFHNEREFNNKIFFHMAIPYKISKIEKQISTKLIKPFWKIPETIIPLEKIFNLDDFQNPEENGIIITHVDYIADYISPNETSLIKLINSLRKK